MCPMVSPPAGAAGELFQALVEYGSDANALLDEHGIVRFESHSKDPAKGNGLGLSIIRGPSPARGGWRLEIF